MTYNHVTCCSQLTVLSLVPASEDGLRCLRIKYPSPRAARSSSTYRTRYPLPRRPL
jgi:hypothetical protein